MIKKTRKCADCGTPIDYSGTAYRRTRCLDCANKRNKVLQAAYMLKNGNKYRVRNKMEKKRKRFSGIEPVNFFYR